jgi:hypothetical protein
VSTLGRTSPVDGRARLDCIWKASDGLKIRDGVCRPIAIAWERNPLVRKNICVPTTR